MTEMSDISDRLKTLIDALKINASKFALSIGADKGQMSSYVNGKYKPGYDIISAILLEYRNLNPWWLILGEGEIFIDKKSNYSNNIPPVSAGEPSVTYMDSDYHLKIIESLVSQNEKLQNEVSNFSAIQKDMAMAQAEMAATR